MEEGSKFYRSKTNRTVAGVCGGLGEYFGIDATLVRLVFVVLAFLGGSGILLYIALWLLVPENPSGEISHDPPALQNPQSRKWWGIFLVGFGSYFLLQNMGVLDWISISALWPIAFIVIGIVILVKRQQ